MKTPALLARLTKWRRITSWVRPWRLVSQRLIAVSSLQGRAVLRPRRRKPSLSPCPSLMVVLSVIILTGAIGYRFYNQPQLNVGTVVSTPIVAPRDGSFEDRRTTEEKRKAIQTGIIPVLRHDDQIGQQVQQEISRFIAQVQSARDLAGDFPLIAPASLSWRSQQYLRSSSEAEWQVFQEILRGGVPTLAPLSLSGQAAARELQRYRQQVAASSAATLASNLARSRRNYQQALQQLPTNPQFLSRHWPQVLSWDEVTWQQTQTTLQQASDRMLTQGIAPGLPPNLIEAAVAIQLDSLPPASKPLARDFLLNVLRPNLIEDKEQTKQRAAQAAQAVEPVVVEIAQGEAIVAAGEAITQEDFVLLDGFGLSRRGIHWPGLGLAALLVSLSVGILALVAAYNWQPLRQRDQLLLCLMSLSAPVLALLGGPRYVDLPAIALLTSSFYSPALAIAQVSLLSGLVAFAAGPGSWDYLIANAAGGLLAAALAGRLRCRDDLSLLGVAAGLVQGGTYLIVNLIFSASAGAVIWAVLPGAVTYGLSAIAWSVVAMGISPYLERLFDLVTPIRLAELSNPNRPLLKRLALEAPGTFQHTLFVASLAEAAARELHANVELVRAGTLYHDIGKLHDPLGFIENQMGGPNKHDCINDPWKSAQIIKKHVSAGLVMARKYGLPKAIQQFIPEHQGTLLISYFYFQGKHRAEQEGKTLCESDFRYDGPIPQCRETGIVMLADGCEAALRSLKEASPDIALLTVQKIFKARWRDGQLADSGLRYEELPKIAEVFVRVWQQFNHQRVPYPKLALESQPSCQLR